MKTIYTFVNDNFPIIIICAVPVFWAIGYAFYALGPVYAHYAHIAW